MSKKVILETRIHPDGLQLLATATDAVVIGPLPNHTEVIQQLRNGAHGLITSSALRITEELLASAPALEVVGRPGVGVDNIDLPGATAQGVIAVYTPSGPTESTAEHAVALLMALAKQVCWGDHAIRESGFAKRRALIGTEVLGKTLAIVGLGRIGRRVAEICGQGLHMHVIAHDPYVAAGVAAELGVELRRDLHSVLREADFVSLHTPLVPQTRGLIGAAELALLKPTAYLINTSRGPVVDEEALIEVLREGRIAGAGLDVFATEPIPFPHPLLELDNVVVTPHIASSTDDGLRKMGVMVVQEVLSVLRGEKPRYVANPEVLGRANRANL